MDSFVAANIRRLLEVKGWTQEELAYRAGVGQGTVSRWLSGSTPRFEVVAKLAELAGTTADVFAGEVWGEGAPLRRSLLPSEEQLTEMLANVQAELPANLSFADWPRAAAAALLVRLSHYAGEHSTPPAATEGPVTLHAAPAQFHHPTKPAARE